MAEADFEVEYENRKYWEEVGETLGLVLCGWSYRHYATFFYGRKYKTIQMDHELAEILVAQVKKAKTV
jgi:hypothetical protein